MFRYLNGTRNLSLVYGGKIHSDKLLIAYTDADWASNPNDRKSISGNTFLLGGASIGWMSKKQTVTANSTCDAEYVAAAACARHVTWLRNLFLCLGFQQDGPTQIYCDNQAAISLSRDFQFHAKSKHIDIQHHYIHEYIKKGDIDVVHILSTENPADLFTELLS